MSTFRRLLLAGLCLAPLTILLAQETRPRVAPGREPPARAETTTTTTTTASSAKSPQIDHFLVSCLKQENQGEITIAKLAEQRATDPEVKAFAQELIKDHTDFLAKLDRFAQEGNRPAASATRTEIRRTETTTRPEVPSRTDPAQPDRNDKTARPERAKDATNPPARADVRVDTTRGDVTVQAGGHDGVAEQLLAIKQEISDRCLASAQRELSEKEGKEFDHCFMAMQVGGHMKMVDSLTVFKNHTSGELQQTLDEGLKTTQRHLEHAKQLAKKGGEGSSASARPGSDRPATERSTTERPGTDAPAPRKERVK